MNDEIAKSENSSNESNSASAPEISLKGETPINQHASHKEHDGRDVLDLTPQGEAAPRVEAKEQNSESAIAPEEIERITNDIIAAVKTVYDPEIPVDIYELGLIYKVDLDDDYNVDVEMTLTAPGCPVAGEMPIWVENAVRSVQGINDVKVALTFDPPWEPSLMSDEARVALNFF